eukprot:scaffold19212_cov141-Isochrysis_galbana.AAC.2
MAHHRQIGPEDALGLGICLQDAPGQSIEALSDGDGHVQCLSVGLHLLHHFVVQLVDVACVVHDVREGSDGLLRLQGSTHVRHQVKETDEHTVQDVIESLLWRRVHGDESGDIIGGLPVDCCKDEVVRQLPNPALQMLVLTDILPTPLSSAQLVKATVLLLMEQLLELPELSFGYE